MDTLVRLFFLSVTACFIITLGISVFFVVFLRLPASSTPLVLEEMKILFWSLGNSEVLPFRTVGLFVTIWKALRLAWKRKKVLKCQRGDFVRSFRRTREIIWLCWRMRCPVFLRRWLRTNVFRLEWEQASVEHYLVCDSRHCCFPASFYFCKSLALILISN